MSGITTKKNRRKSSLIVLRDIFFKSKKCLEKKHRTRSTILTDEYGRVVGDREPG